MDTLEDLASRLAGDLSRLTWNRCPCEDPEEVLAAATLVNKLARQLDSPGASRLDPDADTSAAGSEGAAVVKTCEEKQAALVVDGECEDRLTASEFLAANGYAVLQACDGEEAFAAAEQHAGPIRLLLTNVLLPDVSGRELAERLALLQPDVSVIYMSGYTDDEILHYGVLGPEVLTLQKPIQVEALAERVAAALRPLQPV